MKTHRQPAMFSQCTRKINPEAGAPSVRQMGMAMMNPAMARARSRRRNQWLR